MLEAGVALTAFFFVLELGGWRYGELLGPVDPLYLQATTACLAAIVVSQMVNVFVCRHPSEAAIRFLLGQNRLLLFGLAAEVGLLLLIVYTSPGNRVFATQAFDPVSWTLMLALALGFGALEELRKRFWKFLRQRGRWFAKS